MSSGSCASCAISSKRSCAQRLELVQPRLCRRGARAIARSSKRDRIEVVVGERDEPEAEAPQLDDLAGRRDRRARCRGSWPSVRHTEQNEQCFGQPRTVCTDAHM